VWERAEKRSRTVRGRRRVELYYPVVCAGCGNERWLRRCDAIKAVEQDSPCLHCASAIKGRKGYRATVAKYGEKPATRRVQNYRLAHPSSLEQIVINELERAGLRYARELWFEQDGSVWLVDFQIGQLLVEVNGTWVHAQRADRDAAKLAALAAAGYPVLVLSEADVKAGRSLALIQEQLAVLQNAASSAFDDVPF
jgi:very-short-patch-repair endonuclease